MKDKTNPELGPELIEIIAYIFEKNLPEDQVYPEDQRTLEFAMDGLIELAIDNTLTPKQFAYLIHDLTSEFGVSFLDGSE